MAASAAARADSASTARPRLVCSTVPVRLKTGVCEGRDCSSALAAACRATAGGVVCAGRTERDARMSASTARTQVNITWRPNFWMASTAGSLDNTASTEGRGSRSDGVRALFFGAALHPRLPVCGPCQCVERAACPRMRLPRIVQCVSDRQSRHHAQVSPRGSQSGRLIGGPAISGSCESRGLTPRQTMMEAVEINRWSMTFML